MRPTELLPTTSGARPAPLATVPSYSSRPYPVSPPLNFSDFERIDKGGGDNSIYTVVHRPTGAPYSIKVIRYNQDGRLRREILREIEISRDLNNPNVVKCHGVFDHASEIQVLIEYMDGRSLEGVHVPDEPSLADLTFQILSGLSYLHHRKIAHGDIKPSNLLIGSVGLVKIAYFGLSRISTSAVKPNDSSTKAIAYSSPERINTDLSQGVYDGCAGDIWGIGLIILEVYLGIYPKTPEAPPTASREFRDFIARCLQTDPAKRWTAQQLLQHPFILLNTDINDNVDGNAADKTLSRNLKEIESKSDPFSRTGKPCKWRGATTKIYDVNPNEFYQKVMELTGMGRHTMETPHQTVGAVTEGEGEAEAEAETEEQLFVRQTVEPSLPSIEVPDQALCHMDRQFKSCILYCSLFPVGYKFEKDSLVQLWIAEGLIKAEGNERMEDVGGLCFDYLSRRGYVVPSGFDHFGNRETYRVGEAMASILKRESLAPLYCKVENSHFADLSILSMHLSLVCNYIDQNTFEAIKRCRNLRTLLLLGDHDSSAKQVPYDLFLGLELLRVLNLSCTHLSQLPNSIGNLKSLRYIDVSETRLKRLPESVDCLQNLQTLRLRDCLDLVGLPKNISKLVNLRHLDLDIARQLKSMPTRMGNLTNLQTLRTFLVGREDGCRIGELKNMNNISGSLCIWRLENVLSKEEAKVAALSNKRYLNKLELRWGDLRDGKAEHEEEILECLQPYSGLKELQILFYRGSMLPSWISSPSFVNIASITLYKCTSCYLLPSIGELPSLKSLTVVEMNMVRDINRLFCRDRASQGYHAFPKLEKLTFDVMFNLEEWTGVENGDFPLLLHLTIKYCPKLISLPLLSLLISLKYFEISHCPELSSFPEEGLPASLGFLMVRNCPALKERCQKGEGEDWFKIAHVPSIWIDHQEIFLD